MNRLFFFLFLISIFFLACSKEEEENILTPSFECYIDGENFSTTNITTSSAPSYALIILATNSQAIVTLKFFRLSIPEQGETIEFSTPASAIVEIYNTTYWNTYSPPYDGEVYITKKSNGLISGTFFFKATDVNPTNFIPIEITNGVFSNIPYE